MLSSDTRRRFAAFLSLAMIVSGFSLGVWSFVQFPGRQIAATGRTTDSGHTSAPLSDDGPVARTSAGEIADTGDASIGDAIDNNMPPALPPVSGPDRASQASQGTAPYPAAPTPIPLAIELGSGLPAAVLEAAHRVAIGQRHIFTTPSPAVATTLRLDLAADSGRPFYRQFFVAATRFDTIDPTVSYDTVQRHWRENSGDGAVYESVAVLEDTIPALTQILGPKGPIVTGYAGMDEVVEAAWSEAPTLALVPFERLTPRLAVLAVDGQNPVENANRFDPEQYPLIATVYLHVPAPSQESQALEGELLAQSGSTNRNPDHLTVVAMTGVTAMVRQTAYQMDRFGPQWPAEVVGPELAAADITAISNEVPFVPGCQTNTDMDNLTFCSKPEYMAALIQSGADVVGLTGNHLNDYDTDGALQSLAIYAEAGLPVYGGGKDRAAALAPLYVEHNGNRLAFLGANSFGPRSAWATESRPGSAEFDLNIMSATVRNIKDRDRADVVLAELQYQESYRVEPLLEQRQDFRALVRAGADIVTGVQSHVPQAMEFEDGKLILYGLGNLYFDQMWNMATREGLIVKHTIYEGRHISTQILTTLLYDYGQPRWTTGQERARILRRVFEAGYWQTQ